jgi:hypothetical protein
MQLLSKTYLTKEKTLKDMLACWECKACQISKTHFAEELTSSESLCQNFLHKLITFSESRFA